MRWPDAAAVRAAAESWAGEVAAQPGVCSVGLFGSLARGGWGVGSDVDLVVIIEASDEPFMERPASFLADALPVSADVLVYTRKEWMQGGCARLGYVHWIAGSALDEALAPAAGSAAIVGAPNPTHSQGCVAPPLFGVA